MKIPFKLKSGNKPNKKKFFDPVKFAKANNISLPELKKQSALLQKNIYNKRMKMAGKDMRFQLNWIPDDPTASDNTLNKLWKSKLIKYDKNKIDELFYQAFGNPKSNTYNPKKFLAIKKNLNEYRQLREAINAKYPNINFELDHPLSKSSLNKLFNATTDQLTRVNVLEADLNNGFKDSLSLQYEKAVQGNNLNKKKAVEKIARDLKLNIGKISDDATNFKYGVKEFQKLNIKDEIGKSLENLSALNKNFQTYAKNNPELFKTAGVSTQQTFTNIKPSEIKGIENILAKIGCPGLASGGRAGFDVGTNCQIKGSELINSGMKNASSAQLKNFVAFANKTASLGKGVIKFGVIPEALFVAADSAIRVGMGDTLNEAFLRASDYLRPGDQTKLAEMLEADRFFGPEVAGIIGRSLDYKNQLTKIQSLEDQKANLENLSGGGDFDYIGDLSQNVKNVDAQIKQATDDLNKFKMTDAEKIYAERMQEEIDDARSSKSFFTKLKSKFKDAEPDSDIETLGVAPELTQQQLNQRILNQAPIIYKVEGNKLIQKNLSEATTSEIMDHVQLLKPYGVDVSTKDLLEQRNYLRGMPLSEQEQIFGKEATYGASGTMGEPINKPVFKRPQNVIGEMENEIVGRTNVNSQGQVINPFDLDISDIGTGLRGFAAAGGGIAKEAGDSSGPPPESGPNSQGLLSLKNRARNY
jgi:hypothetical protein